MEAKELTDEELNQVLLEVIQTAYRQYRPIAVVFDFLYQTGCRFNEVTYLHEWEFQEGGREVEFLARKNKQPRRIPSAWLSERSQTLIETNGQLINHVTYGRARDFMRVILSSHYLSCGGKKLYLHAFRHNFARRLNHTGQNLESIRALMGLKHAGVAAGYVHSNIFQRR